MGEEEGGNKTGSADSKGDAKVAGGEEITGDRAKSEVDLLQKIPTTEEEEEEGGGGGAGEPSEEMARSLKDIWENGCASKWFGTRRSGDLPTHGGFGHRRFEQFLADFKLKYKSVARDLLRWEAECPGPPKTVEQMTATAAPLGGQ